MLSLICYQSIIVFAEETNLEQYLEEGRYYESIIIKEDPLEIDKSRFFVRNQTDNDIRLQSIASQLDYHETIVCYVIGINWVPNGIGLKKGFQQPFTYANTKLDQIQIGSDIYSIHRFSIQSKNAQSNCPHIWTLNSQKKATNYERGVNYYHCSSCMELKKIYTLPNSELGNLYQWKESDLVTVSFEGASYLFRCIDINFHNGNALFLSEEIIPNDYGSTYEYKETVEGGWDYVWNPGPIVDFGETNDYKYSNIHLWLKKVTPNYISKDISIGVNTSYEGKKRRWEEEDQMKSYFIGTQKLYGSMFVFSMEEALIYESYLWEVTEDTKSTSYYLRTPMGNTETYDETNMIYTVNMAEEIMEPHPCSLRGISEDVDGTNVGIRPAFILQQP